MVRKGEMKLQVAFDIQNSDEVLNLVGINGDLIDIVEIGTPLIMKEGLKSVRRIKKEYPNQTILADLKIMDAGLLEAQMGFDAGADIVSVLGLASKKTLTSVKQTADQNGGKVMVDMINHPNPEKKWYDLMKMGMDYCCLHTAVAGGIKPDMMREIKCFQPEIVVVGSYIADANNHREALTELHQAMV